MSRLRAIISTPWVEREGPQGERLFDPQVVFDYPHAAEIDMTLVSSHTEIGSAMEACEAAGDCFRQVYSPSSPHGAEGFGVRVPQWIWDSIVATAEDLTLLPNERFIGWDPDPAGSSFDVFKFHRRLVRAGVHSAVDVTEQPGQHIPPANNQFSVEVILDESVLQSVISDPQYCYLCGLTIGDDSSDPAPVASSSLERAPGDVMSADHYQQLVDWQTAHGVPLAFLDALKSMGDGILAHPSGQLTYGQVAVLIASWQQTLAAEDGLPPELPNHSMIAHRVSRSLSWAIEENRLSFPVRQEIAHLRNESRKHRLRG